MTDPTPESRRDTDLGWQAGNGTGTALGVGAGTVVFAITEDASWIAWGAAGGLVIGAIVGRLGRSSRSKADDR